MNEQNYVIENIIRLANDACLGTAQFVKNYGLNNIHSNNIFELLNFCQNNGIYNFDTSILYGNSIKILSDHLKDDVNIYKIKDC